MLEKILLVGVFIMTTLSANANELEEPVVSSKLSAMQESADTYAPGCDDSYRGVYPPHYPPHYPPQFPRPRPPQNSKKFCKQFKKDFYACTRDPRARSLCYWDYNDNKCRERFRQTRCTRIRDPRSCERKRGCFFDYYRRSCRDRP